MLPLALTALLLGGGPSRAPTDSGAVRNREPDVGAVLVGAGLGAVTGAALGVGASFALVYGTNENGCYVGGCDAPLLAASIFSVFSGSAGALAGAAVGGIIGGVLSE